jgi:hypothetical protein
MEMNPYLLEFELRERRRQMLEEARRQRLIALFNGRLQQKSDKFFLRLAELLIRFGEHLKRRHSHGEALTSGLCRE